MTQEEESDSYKKLVDYMVHSAVVDERISQINSSIYNLQDNLKSMQEGFQGEISDFKKDVSSLRKTIITFSLGISLSSITFAFTVFTVVK